LSKIQLRKMGKSTSSAGPIEQVGIGEHGSVSESDLQETVSPANSTTGGREFFDPGKSVRKLLPRAMKGGLAVVDQALVTGSNFALAILLARWLTPLQYGAYAVGFSVFVLVGMLYQALLLEGMSVFGASVSRSCLRKYLKSMLSLHLAVASVIFVVLGASAGVAFKIAPSSGLPGALAGIAVATPLILLFWLAKRAFYLQLTPGPSTAGAFLYCVTIVGGLFLIDRRGLISPFSAFTLMGLGAFGTSIFLFTHLKFRLPADTSPPSQSDTWRRHWKYGRWAVLAEFSKWVPAYIFYPLLSSFRGIAQAGELRALMNFNAAIFQTYAALSSLLLPYAARVFAREGRTGTVALTKRIALGFASGGLLYWGVLLTFKRPIFHLLYSGRYTDLAGLLPVVALSSIFWSANLGPTDALRAMESSGSVLAAVCISSTIAVAVGIPLTWALGLSGAIWSMTLSEGLALLMTVILLRRKLGTASPPELILALIPPSATEFSQQ
jgi:O-antigen/teichoic acid export membrane protein